MVALESLCGDEEEKTNNHAFTKDYFKLLTPGTIKYDKKVMIIYNPHSGRKIEIKDKISTHLTANNIEFEFYVTKGV